MVLQQYTINYNLVVINQEKLVQLDNNGCDCKK